MDNADDPGDGTAHRIHPPSIPAGELDPGCARCQRHTLATLDMDHFLAVTGMSLNDTNLLTVALINHPAIRELFLELNALAVQERVKAERRGKRRLP